MTRDPESDPAKSHDASWERPTDGLLMVTAELSRGGAEFPKVLDLVAERLVTEGPPSVTSRFTLESLAAIPPKGVHPAAIIPVIDSFLGGDQARTQVLADHRASHELLQEAIDRDLSRGLDIPKIPTQTPDTYTWNRLFNNLAVKRKYAKLSPPESAVYEALTVYWFASPTFENAPRIVPLVAQYKLAYLIAKRDGVAMAISTDVQADLTAHLMAPNDPTLRAVLRDAECCRERLVKPQQQYVRRTFEAASPSFSTPFLLNRVGAEWPEVSGDSVRDALLCMRRRALVSVQVLELYCYQGGFIDSLSSESVLGALVGREKTFASKTLNSSLGSAEMSSRNSSVLSHGLRHGRSAAAKEAHLVAIQELLVAQYLDYKDRPVEARKSWDRPFASTASIAAECGIEIGLAERYIAEIREVPWFREILKVRKKLLETAPKESEEVAPPIHGKRFSLMHLTATGCRYRNEFFESQSEAAVAVLLEKYLRGFVIERGQTFQVGVEHGKRIDFRLGRFDGTAHFLEFHPIVLGRPGCQHDFKSDFDAYSYHMEYSYSSAKAQRRLYHQTVQALSNDYLRARLKLVQEKEPSATLHHIQQPSELYDLLGMLGSRAELPTREEFVGEFTRIRQALGALQFAESLLEEAIQRDYPALYERDWRRAAPDRISRPIESLDPGRYEKTDVPPVITSFAHRGQKRAVEVTVPFFFDPSLRYGRGDDAFYASPETFVSGLAYYGYSALCISAASIHQTSVNELVHEVVEFLTALGSAALVSHSNVEQDPIFAGLWIPDLFSMDS